MSMAIVEFWVSSMPLHLGCTAVELSGQDLIARLAGELLSERQCQPALMLQCVSFPPVHKCDFFARHGHPTQ